MNKIQKKIATVVAAGSLFVQVALPAIGATTTLEITGNGSGSDNEVELETNYTTTVVQQNHTSIQNDIEIDADTGNNDLDGNTGGDVSLRTGDIDVEVGLTNVANSNVANVENCGGCLMDTEVLISGNGSDSDNEVELEFNNKTELFQFNTAWIDNKVDVNAETGYNDVDDNTQGDIVVRTGDIDVEISATTMANMNSAVVMGNGNGGGSLSAQIIGNGSDSDNEIELELSNWKTLVQNNWTAIHNDIDVDADTGNNDVDDNTGGSVGMLTGDIDVEVMVDNMAGFNWASLDCCFLDNILAKISGNGSDSNSEIEATIDAGMDVFQTNSCGFGFDGPISALMSQPIFGGLCFDNDIDVDAQSGDNDIDDSTGAVDSDPLLITGDIEVEVEASNTGGSNVFGADNGFDFDWPNVGGMNLNFSFNLMSVLAMMLGWM